MKTILLFVIMFSSSLFAAEPIKIRIGWQVPWAVQGQLVQILKHTDILKKNGLEAEFIGRNFGPELNELAMGSEIDVVLTADQPAAMLFSKEKGWIGISKLMYNRTSTYVPIKSPIKNVEGLKGKTIGVPFGAAAERIIVGSLVAKGMDPAKDVKLVNLGIQEHAPLVIKGGPDAVKWDQFDALSGFDPVPAILKGKNLVREIDIGKVCSLILMNNDFLNKHPTVALAVITSFRDAYLYYSQNRKQADEWFMQEAKFDIRDSAALEIAASLEPNVTAKNAKKIRMSFLDTDYKIMQKAADFIAKTAKKEVHMDDYVTNDYSKQIK